MIRIKRISKWCFSVSTEREKKRQGVWWVGKSWQKRNNDQNIVYEKTSMKQSEKNALKASRLY